MSEQSYPGNDKSRTNRFSLNRFSLTGHWGSRPESVAISATRMAEFLLSLKAIHPMFAGQWRRFVLARDEAALYATPPRPLVVDDTVRGINDIFEESRRDPDNPEWVSAAENGHSLRFIAPHSSCPAVSVRCGVDIAEGAQGRNLVHVAFPDPGTSPWVDPDLADIANVFDGVLRLVVEQWQVDTARIHDTILSAEQDPTGGSPIKKMALLKEERRGIRTGLRDFVMWEQYDGGRFRGLNSALLPPEVELTQFDRGAILRLGDNPLRVPIALIDQTRHSLGYPSISR